MSCVHINIEDEVCDPEASGYFPHRCRDCGAVVAEREIQLQFRVAELEAQVKVLEQQSFDAVYNHEIFRRGGMKGDIRGLGG